MLSLFKNVKDIEKLKFPIKPSVFLKASKYHYQAALKHFEKLSLSDFSDSQYLDALDELGTDLSALTTLAYTHKELLGPSYEKLCQNLSKLNIKLSTVQAKNKAITKRLVDIYNNRQNLSSEHYRLSKLYYDGLKDSGAFLSKANLSKLSRLQTRLADLEIEFSSLADKSWSETYITVPYSESAGIPIETLEAAALKSPEGVYRLYLESAPNIAPFAEHESVRKNIFDAKRLTLPENNERINEILKLREDVAKLLSYESYIDMTLKDRMINNYPVLIRLLDDIAVKVTEKAEEASRGVNLWDETYVNSQARKALGLDQTELRKYFPLEKVLEGLYSCVDKIFNLQIICLGASTLFKDAFVVQLTRDGELIGDITIDLWSRENKSFGAWANALKLSTGEGHAFISADFVKSPTLSFNSVQTLFHEMGHALHALLSLHYNRHESFNGLRVSTDFVELPSQLMEEWLFLPEVVISISEHIETKESLPIETALKLTELRKIGMAQGYRLQMYLLYLDLYYHEASKEGGDAPIDHEAIDKRAWDKTLRGIPYPGGSSASTFTHIFGSSYAVGYYCYLWADILVQGAWKSLCEDGSPLESPRLKSLIKLFEKGNSVSEAELFQSLVKNGARAEDFVDML